VAILDAGVGVDDADRGLVREEVRGTAVAGVAIDEDREGVGGEEVGEVPLQSWSEG
jgi:hypothetical protein